MLPTATVTTTTPPRGLLPGLYGVLLLSLLGRVVFTAWEPPVLDGVRYDDVGAAYWPMNLYLGGPSYLLSFLGTAAFVLLLATGRSAAVTRAAAALIALGGVLFSLAITAEALPFAYAADRAVLPEPDGRALVDALNADLGRVTPAIVAGSLAVALGVLATLAAGWLTGALPRPFVAAGVLYLVAFLALPPDALPRPAALAFYIVEVALLAALGWFGLRRGVTR